MRPQPADRAEQAPEKDESVPASGLVQTNELDAALRWDLGFKVAARVKREDSHVELLLVKAVAELDQLALGAASVEAPNQKCDANSHVSCRRRPRPARTLARVSLPAMPETSAHPTTGDAGRFVLRDAEPISPARRQHRRCPRS